MSPVSSLIQICISFNVTASKYSFNLSIVQVSAAKEQRLRDVKGERRESKLAPGFPRPACACSQASCFAVTACNFRLMEQCVFPDVFHDKGTPQKDSLPFKNGILRTDTGGLMVPVFSEEPTARSCGSCFFFPFHGDDISELVHYLAYS